VEYFAVLCLAALARLIPAPVSDLLGAGLGRLAYYLLASRRRITIDNLRRGIGDSLTDKQIQETARAVFSNIGRTIFELPRLKRLSREDFDRIVAGSGQEKIRQALSGGKGGILIAPHFGNWEMMAGWVAAQGFPMDLLIGIQHNSLVDELLIGLRRSMGVGIIRSDTGVRGVFKALKANRLIGVVADQHDPANGIILDFFGRKASQVKGPAAFSVKIGCPVIPMALRRERYDRHVAMIGDVIYPPCSGNVDQDILDVTLQYTRFFEEIIRRHPDQWMWTHRRWKV